MAILGHPGLRPKVVQPSGPISKLARPGSLLRRLLPEQRERQLSAH
jgi:hypothetical protein